MVEKKKKEKKKKSCSYINCSGSVVKIKCFSYSKQFTGWSSGFSFM